MMHAKPGYYLYDLYEVDGLLTLAIVYPDGKMEFYHSDILSFQLSAFTGNSGAAKKWLTYVGPL